MVHSYQSGACPSHAHVLWISSGGRTRRAFPGDALDLDGLRRPEVTFWSVLDGDALVGCGAIKKLDAGHAELKSMRTSSAHKRSGIASQLLEHILTEAKRMGLTRISLETGSAEFFQPARRLYRKFGFDYCEPFGDYRPDPNSVFMTRTLQAWPVGPEPSVRGLQ